MYQFYICVRPYKNIRPGTCWYSRPYHYMFRQMGYDEYQYITPYELKKYFIEVK